ncbi:uncharacterized protein LOC118434032 [Folsomia candida]|nr:uncharacterized protein LOC118434032 [Folsomia candida]
MIIHVPPNPISHSLPQQLLASSPALEKLRILANWYPHLNANPNLRSIYYTGTTEASLNLEDLSRMLCQVSFSLERLELALFNEDGIPLVGLAILESANLNLSLPLLPKLDYLKCHSVDIFFRNTDGRIPSEKMPVLKTLNISNLHGRQGDDLLNYIFKPGVRFDSVKTLAVDGVMHPEPLAALLKSTTFPALQQLHVSVCAGSDNEQAQRDLISRRDRLLEEFLKSCVHPKLKYLKILTQFPEKMTTFISCLENGSDISKNLKTLTIQNYGNSEFDDDLRNGGYRSFELVSNFKKILLRIGKLTRVTISGINLCGESAQEIVTFIDNNKLSIKFEDYCTG